MSKQITYENGLLAVWLSDNIKQAVATGWDCPRAHILVKLRDRMSETFEISDDILSEDCVLLSDVWSQWNQEDIRFQIKNIAAEDAAKYNTTSPQD